MPPETEVTASVASTPASLVAVPKPVPDIVGRIAARPGPPVKKARSAGDVSVSGGGESVSEMDQMAALVRTTVR